MEWWGTLLISLGTAIIGALVGGLFTWLSAKSNQNHEEKMKNKEIIDKANELKPRLEIQEYNDFNSKKDDEVNEECLSILALGILGFADKDGRAFFKYNDKAVKDNDLVCVEYVFENTGKTEIEEICFSSNLPRWMSIFDMSAKEFYLKNHLLNYDAWANKRYIKPNETVKVRIYYVNNQIPSTNMGSPEFIVWLRDINGFLWSQTLNAPAKEIEISRMRKQGDLKEAIDIRKRIECFRNPILW